MAIKNEGDDLILKALGNDVEMLAEAYGVSEAEAYKRILAPYIHNWEIPGLPKVPRRDN